MNKELKLILEMCIQPDKLKKISLKNFSEDKIIELLIKNQVMLPFLKNLPKIGGDDIYQIQNKIKRSLQKEFLIDSELKTKYTLLLMKELNIDCMIPKPLYFKREQGDVDILVPGGKLNFVIKELAKRNFLKTSYESNKIGMTKYEGSSKFTIHVHAKIKWESEFIPTNEVWNRSRIVEKYGIQVRIPSPEDILLIDCAHVCFEASLIRLCDVLQLAELIKVEKVDWEKITTRLIEYHIPAAGYVYFFAMNHITTKIFKNSIIPSEVLLLLEKHINKKNELFATKRTKNQIALIDEIDLPLRLSLFSNAILFVSFNERFGLKKTIWAYGVLFSALIRHFLVKLRLRKL